MTTWRPEPCDLSAPPELRIAGRVRELRIDAEMTQLQLARCCGVERTHVNRWEHGKHTLLPATLARIAAALDVDMGTLCCVLDEGWCTSARAVERLFAAPRPAQRVSARRMAA